MNPSLRQMIGSGAIASLAASLHAAPPMLETSSRSFHTGDQVIRWANMRSYSYAIRVANNHWVTLLQP